MVDGAASSGTFALKGVLSRSAEWLSSGCRAEREPWALNPKP